MSSAQVSLVVSVFLASSVETVEAFTIVLALGTTRSWSSTLLGVAAGALVLIALIAIFASSLVLLPIADLRLVVGGLLLMFGLQWLRKAILRAAGLLAVHDELAAFARETQSAERATRTAGEFDGYSFVVAFKGVLLEGLEVVFIVVTFGANQHRIGLAALAAGASVLTVLLAALAVRAPLARVPENTMKFAVGVLLTSFGAFWAAEGAGADWPGGESALPVLVIVIGAGSLALARDVRRRYGAGLMGTT
jgi:uncharacterized membrane protein